MRHLTSKLAACFALALLFLLPAPRLFGAGEASIILQDLVKVADLLALPCNADRNGQIKMVSDGDDATDCATGGGSTLVFCSCSAAASEWVQFGTLLGISDAETIGDYVLITKAGQQAITATGAGNDITLTAADDIILAATGDLTFSGAAGTVAVTTTFAIDAGGGTDELGIAEGLVGLMGINFYGAHTGPTALGVTCNAGAEGDFFYAVNAVEMCFCNGTGWVKFSDATTACPDPE